MKRVHGWTWSATLAAAMTLLATPHVRAEEFAAEPAPEVAAAPEKAPPLPFHTIEGYGGGAITPMAYLINPGPEGTFLSKPSFALSYVGLGHKNLSAITITETVCERVEIGYGADRLGLGTLPSDILDATNVDIEHTDVWLHNWNVRLGLVKENECFLGIPMPALTAGVHFKYNSGIRGIDERLGGALTGLGFDRASGTDFTLTASKTFASAIGGRPLIVSAGLRESQAANLGFLGFAENYHASFEGNVAYLPFDWLLVAYEIRQKTSPYGEIPGLIGDEDVWNAIDVGLILNKHTTLVIGWGDFGTLANSEASGAWWLQMKHEF
jgi:hypothetical protein